MSPEQVAKLRQRDKEWQEANSEKYKKSCAEYRKTHRDVMKAQQLRFEAKAREQLKDSYVRRKLARRLEVSPSQVPDELIDIQRGIMLLKRLLKEARSGQTQA